MLLVLDQYYLFLNLNIRAFFSGNRMICLLIFFDLILDGLVTHGEPALPLVVHPPKKLDVGAVRHKGLDDLVELHRLCRDYAPDRGDDGIRGLAGFEVLAVFHPRLGALVDLAGLPDMEEIVAAPGVQLVV